MDPRAAPTLFPLDTPAADAVQVPGLRIVDDWIDAGTEQALLAHVDAGEWRTDFKRRVQVFGLGYGAAGESTWLGHLPPWLLPLAQRLVDESVMPRLPENCVINDYTPGVGIAPHRDYSPFGQPIAALSLLSDVIMSFDHADSDARTTRVLRARSLCVMGGAARWRWRHGIALRKSDVIDGVRVLRKRRVSITFRIAKDPALVSRLLDASRSSA
jgi:alkylated DNA repair dioxygenase AlkB